MGLANIKLTNKAERGFTIVELLIVVVVIAILAAITIVSYNGITGRANASASKSLAATWAKKIELHQAEESSYPWNSAALRANSAKSWYINDSSLVAAAPTEANGTKNVMIQSCGATTPTANAGVTAVVISYYDYDAKNVATRTVGANPAPSACAAAWTNP